jgi:flagellin
MIPNMNFAIGYSAEYGAIQNNMFNVQKKLDKVMENLSTGSKVNDMKDDMSGKAIADVLQSWKVGTDQTIENIKEFISFTKTAENALDKLQEVLFDMKQTVDRLTGVDNPSENGIAQNELESDLMAYERIVEQTQFKGWKVFDEGFLAIDTGNMAQLNTFRYRNFRFAAGRESSMTWDLGLAPKAMNMGLVKNYVANIEVEADSAAGELGLEFYSSGTISNSSGSMDILGIKKGDVIINGIDLYEAAKAVDSMHLKESVGINRIDTLEKALEFALGGNASVQVVVTTGETISGSHATLKLYINTPFEFDVQGTSVAQILFGQLGNQETVQLMYDLNTKTVDEMAARAQYNDGAFVELTYTAMGNGIDKALYTVDSSGEITALAENTADNTNLQTVSVLSMQQAGDAKVIIEAAIQQIDEMRGVLAAYQKQAEYLISNRQVESNKVEAQISQLTETDYAKELAKLTKQQIIQQAGVNMLAQKRQMAQLITQLLR